MILISYLFISDPSFHFDGSWLALSRGRGGERYLTRFSDFCETVYFEPERYLTILSDSDFCENVVL